MNSIKIYLLIAFTFFIILISSAQTIKDKVNAHEEAFHIFNAWMRDPFITIAPDGKYYLSCTDLSSEYNKVRFPIYVSDDLANWTLTGRPYSLEDVSHYNQYNKSNLRLWAPEMHYLNNKWVVVHTSSEGIGSFSISNSTSVVPFSAPFTDWGRSFGKKHDPNIFVDDNGSKWLIWAATKVQKLKDDLTGVTGPEYSIGPSNRKIGHEGSQIIKVGSKYVLFGTAWSTDNMRDGTYNLYYCTADKITGPYGVRKFAGRCLGHGTIFKDKQERWWCAAFANGSYKSPDDVVSKGVPSGTAITMNKGGLTLVPMAICISNGDVLVYAKDERYQNPGNEEVQKFATINPVCNGNCTDDIKPSVPGISALISSSFSSVELSWENATDNIGVTGYNIYVDSKKVMSSTTNNVVISNLICETTYVIQISAFDACDNESALNASLNVRTATCPPCTDMPTVNGGNGAESGQIAYKAMNLPCTILAEDMDEGANGVAYFDNGYGGNTVAERPTWSTEHGFRLTSDVEFDENGGNTFIGGINSGEWAEYTVVAPTAGTYKLSGVNYFTNPGNNAKIYFKMDDAVSCLYDLPNTNSELTNLPLNFEFLLTAGNHVFAWVSEGSKYNLEDFTIDMALASTKIKAASALTIYPNPFSSELNVETKGKSVAIYSVSGTLINAEINVNNGLTTINTAQLQSGMYFIKAGNTVKMVTKM